MTGYGEELGELVIGDCSAAAERTGRNIVYTRRCRGIGEKKLYLAGAERLVVKPIYPVLYPKHFTTYILIHLSPPIHIAPRAWTTVYIEVPVDIAVYAYTGRREEGGLEKLAAPLRAIGAAPETQWFSIIDVFPVDRVKYTLYGPPENGVLARHHVSRPMDEPGEARPGAAYARLVLRNRIDEWVTVTRVLYDSRRLRLGYRHGSWEAFLQETHMAITGRGAATISYGGHWARDLRLVPDPEHLRPGRIPVDTDMLWGV